LNDSIYYNLQGDLQLLLHNYFFPDSIRFDGFTKDDEILYAVQQSYVSITAKTDLNKSK
jgi:hypothetical protein